MIIFLHGTDRYRLGKSRDDIIAKYRAKHVSGLNISAVHGADVELLSILESSLKSLSFFHEVRLLVVHDIFFSRDGERTLALLKETDAAANKECVILATHAGPAAEAKPKELFSFLTDKKNLVRHIEPLSGARLVNWIKKEASDRNAPFTSTSLSRFMTIHAKSDSWQMINDLDKLANYCRGPITPAAVEALVRTDSEPNVFEFIEALAGRDRAKAFTLLFKELDSARDPHYLLSMIGYQLRNMLTVKDLSGRGLTGPGLAKAAGVHPFVARKTAGLVSRFTLEDLKARFNQLLELDIAAKNGQADLADALFALTLAA